MCRFDFEGVDVKALFDEYHETEKRMKDLKEKGGIQRQVRALEGTTIWCAPKCNLHLGTALTHVAKA